MEKVDVVRAWKDPSYRCGLAADELASVPSHPAEFTFRRFHCCK